MSLPVPRSFGVIQLPEPSEYPGVSILTTISDGSPGWRKVPIPLYFPLPIGFQDPVGLLGEKDSRHGATSGRCFDGQVKD